MNIKIFALVVLSVAVASAQNYEQSYRQVYCGRELAVKLAGICDNLVKRSSREPGAAGWPWLPRHSARSLSRSKRQQVVSECCDKPCAISELLYYCAY